MSSVSWVKGHTSFEIRANFASSRCCNLSSCMSVIFFIFSDKHPFKKKKKREKKEVFWSHAAKLLKTLTTSRTFRKPFPVCLRAGNNFCSFFFWWDFSFLFRVRLVFLVSIGQQLVNVVKQNWPKYNLSRRTFCRSLHTFSPQAAAL